MKIAIGNDHVGFELKEAVIEVLKEKGVFFDTLSISHKRIHDLHDFVMLSSDDSYISTQSYRKPPLIK